MAGNIKGITIEIGGDTTQLDRSLRDVNQQSASLQRELTQVERLLRFNPGNTELVAQQQQILSERIQSTSQKLGQLRDAQAQVDAQFQRGEISVDQYRAFNRELEATQGQLEGLQNRLSSTQQEQQRLGESARDLQTLFDATGTSVDHFANALGNDLSNAIKEGRASAAQLDEAIERIGRASLGTDADLDRLRQSLRNMDNGGSLDQVRQDLADITQEANQAEDSVNGFGDSLKSVVGGLAAGGGIAGVVSQALDVSSLNTKIDIAFNVPEESRASVKDAINTVTSYGVDAESALEGVRRQWALNKDASDASNSAVVSMAGTISNAYAGVDFTELIQEANEIGKTLGITNEDALGLVNTLLKAGFPPEQIDIIAEYGDQMIQAGFSAKEVQATFAAGVDTKSWNIDNLLDGVKEGRIQMADFGSGLSKEMTGILASTDISKEKFVGWGQAIAKGGEGGQKAMLKATKALASVDDATTRNQLGTKMFGTMWEDQGKKIVDTIINAEGKQVDLKKGTDDLKASTEKLNTDPTVAMKQAFTDLKTELQPLLLNIAEFITKIAEWVSNNTTLVAALAAVGTAIGIIIGVFMALAPIFSVISSLAAALGVTIGAVAAPIGIAIAAIVALVAAGIALWKNWDEVKAFLATVWEGIKASGVAIFEALKVTFQTIWETMKSVVTSVWDGIKAFLTAVWDGIKASAVAIFDALKITFQTIWEAIKSTVTSVWNGIKSFLSSLWNGIKTLASTLFNGIKITISTAWNTIKSLTSTVWDGIKSVISNVWNSIKTTVTTAMTNVKTAISNGWEKAKNLTSTLVEAIKTTVSNIFNKFKEVVATAMGKVKTAVSDGWEKAKSYLEDVNLIDIGKNIIEGLVNGIKNAAGAVKTAVQNIADGIPKAMKKLLGIHSPSRVMRDQVGYWVTEGLAKGISANTNAEKASKNKAQSVVSTFKNKLKELDTKYSAGMINTASYVNSLKTLRSTYGDIAGATTTINAKIAKANTKQATAEQKARQAKQTALAKEFNNKMTNLSNKYSAGILSDSAYIKKLEEMKTKYSSVTNAISKVDLKIANVRKANIKEQFKDDKALYASKKKDAEVSMTEELSILKTLSKHYKKNSEERTYFEDLAKQKKQEITAAKLNINETYNEKVKKLDEDYVSKYEELTGKYTKAVDDREAAIKNFVSIFDEAKLSEDITGEQLLANLQGQNDVLEGWMANLGALAQRGLDEGLIAELQELGPKSAAEIAALNTLSDEQLAQYVTLWQQKANLARTQAISELEGMRIDTANKISQLQLDTKKQLKEYQSEWKNSMKNITRNTKSEFSVMPDIGSYAVQGLIDGMNSRKAELERIAAELAAIVSGTVQDELDIHSPSRVMKKLGEYTNEGFIVGLQASTARLKSAMSNVYGSLASSAQTMTNGSIINNSNYATTEEKTVNNEYNMTFQSPKAINAYEASRLTRNSLKEIALQL